MKQTHGDDDFHDSSAASADDESTAVGEPLDKSAMLLHGVYQALDKSFWKIPEREPDSWHPGVCWEVAEESGEAVMFKGTSQQPKKARYLSSYGVVQPNDCNGLDYTTYFCVDEPRLRRGRNVALMIPERRLGDLTAGDIAEIESALNELKGASDGSR